MRVVPSLQVFGFNLSPQPLWPMGTGAGRPTALRREEDSFPTALFYWDASGRLATVEIALRADRLFKRIHHRWARDGTLDRIEFDAQQPDGSPGPDGVPERESVWTWSDGLPRRREYWAVGADAPHVLATWDWSSDGLSVVVTESSKLGVLVVHDARFDDAGRLLCVDSDRGADGTVDERTTLHWSPDHRIISARQLSGANLSGVHDISFSWDERGRLLGQTNNIGGVVGHWLYHYEDDDTP